MAKRKTTPPAMKAIADARDEYYALIGKTGKKALQQAFKDFFDQHPHVKGIRWNQYTPSFNDGDPCVFGMNGPYVKQEVEPDLVYEISKERGLELVEGGELDDLDDADDEGEDIMEQGGYRDAYDGDENPAVAFYAAIEEFEDLCEDVFGDGVIVTATRRGFKVEEYDHE